MVSGRVISAFVRWFDTSVTDADTSDRRIDWLRAVPFIGMHLACVGVIWVGVSPFAVTTAAVLYGVRMFAITGFYHRYFSHRSFETSRAVQLVFAVLGAAAVQRGPLWWAAHHRHHHRHSDRPDDTHSPSQEGFIWSHLGWFLSRANFPIRKERIPDLMRFPELRFLDRFDILAGVVLATSLYALGALLQRSVPDLGVTGGQLLIWGFFISTVVLYHATFTINSLAHRFGRRRYATADESRNNLWLALPTFGEGWHNNHHHFPASAQQGFYWWEVDITWYLLKLLESVGLVWSLRPVPRTRREAGKIVEPAI
jgi:stearoyl-CoA desaturase (delta-9 desaturase)